jgi:DNA-binding GntR family transcriptional regulator
VDDLSVKNYRPLAELVFEELRKAIFEGRLEPGERLRQEELARMLGVSRTPVREALQRLENEGLVANHSRKGFVVRRFRLEDVQETCMVRRLLEPKAVELAVANITEAELEEAERIQGTMERLAEEGPYDELPALNMKFHHTIFKACRNERLFSVIRSLWDLYPRFGFSVFKVHSRRSFQEHRAILKAIREGDAELAAELSARHLENSVQALTEHLSTLSGEGPA